MTKLTRRDFVRGTAGAAAVLASGRGAAAAGPGPAGAKPAAAGGFTPNYVLSTSLYGHMAVADIAGELKAAGCAGLDLWGGRWGNQREQVDFMGHGRFAEILRERGAKVSCFTCMDTGFPLAEPALRTMRKFGGDLAVAGLQNVPNPKGRRGEALRQGIRAALETLKPIAEVAGGLGVKLAIENHQSGLLETPDACRILVEEAKDPHVGIALAPYHLPQDPAELGRLTADLGEKLFFFYAWQHGDGSGDLAPSRQRRQLPGVGPLDFKPMLAALKRNRFSGYTSIFMHATPRGAPVHATAKEVTAELNKARAWLERELAMV